MVESMYDEASAYTFAYMIRYHMHALRDSGKLERVFQAYCNLMQQHGLFSCFQQHMNRFLTEEGPYENIARNTAPFVVLRGDDTCGGVLQNFADQLAESLMAHGQAVIVVDGAFTEYESLQNNIYKGIIGFQTKALEIDFFRKINGTKFQFWFDYPLCFENILRNLSEDYYVLVQDADYAALVRKYCHTEKAIQFPPAGIDGGCAEQPERPYDLVFMGNYFEADIGDLSEEEITFYHYMIEHPWLTLEKGLENTLKETGKSYDDDFFAARMYRMKQVRRRVIGYYRSRIIDTILAAGYTIHVYGESWHSYRGMHKERLVIHPQATVEESLREFSKAKIGLNIMSWHIRRV